jgi:anti-sigma factor RsiW
MGAETVDAATIERLLIDRRLGELQPDAARLLEAYLELCPGARGAAEHVEATMTLARQAVSMEEARIGAMPPLSSRVVAATCGGEIRSRTRQAAWKPALAAGPAGWVRTWTRRAAIAATIGLAFALGHLTGGNTPPQPLGIISMVPEDIERTKVHGQTNPPEAFWSIERLRRAAGDLAPEARPRVIWTSPLGPPRIGANT